MARRTILAQLHWQPFLHLPGLGALPTPAVYAADEFFAFVTTHGLSAPTPADFAHWSLDDRTRSAKDRLELLSQAFAVCIPAFVPAVVAAHALLPRRTAAPAESRSPGQAQRLLDVTEN